MEGKLISKKVLETLMEALMVLEAESPSADVHGDIDAARRWLDKCPTAPDKAVCPKCGHVCEECAKADVLERLIEARKARVDDELVKNISPPRAPKVEQEEPCKICNGLGKRIALGKISNIPSGLHCPECNPRVQR